MTATIENSLLKVEVSDSGAELSSIWHKPSGKEYLWQGSQEWWPRKAPVLFPIVGKLSNNAYRTEGKTYSLPQHGFARDKEFVLREKTDRSLRFGLRTNEDLLRLYPFTFDLQITYELDENSLIVRYEVANEGDGLMYFSIGAHPGFNCPLNGGETFSDYYLEFEKAETLDRHLLSEGLFNGKTERVMSNDCILPFSEELFSKDALVFKNMKSEVMYLKSKKSSYSLKFSFPRFPYFGIWKKPGASFVCLEPWCGIADNLGFAGELKAKEGIIALEKGKTFERAFSVKIG